MEWLTVPQPMDDGRVAQLTAALRARYPFLDRFVAGTSVLGREITGLTIGRGREKVLLAAGFHGQEWMTAWVTLRLCEEICRALRDDATLYGWRMRRAMVGRSIVLVPLVNPDGTGIARFGSAAAGAFSDTVRALGGDVPGLWQSNARGVDINHNFPAGWPELHEKERVEGITGPAPRRFGGTAPGSEPETAALMELCRRVRFRHVVALHAQGEEIYWSFGAETPPSSRLMALLLSAVSGYAVGVPQGLAVGGGFKDWFITRFNRPGFTLELGRGVNPLPVGTFPAVYGKAAEMLLLSLLM